MSWDGELPDDEILQRQKYGEFRLRPFEIKNLKEIEVNLEENKIHSANKKDILVYLEKLYHKLTNIKKMEYEYEGEENFNINRKLKTVKELIDQVEKI